MSSESLNHLSELRKADRAAMVAHVVRVVEECGATAIVEEMRPRETWINIAAARGLRLTLDFDGESWQPNVHVLSWHFSTDCDTCFADAFGSLNRHHFRKATDTAEGMDELLSILRKRLEQAADGSAFSAEREAAAIAESGTAAERRARFDEWVKDRAS